MSIQGMRNWIKGHRNWIIGLFVLLVLGLVGTYATSGMRNSVGAPTELTAEQKMKSYDAQIEAAREALKKAPEGFGENNTLAGLLFESASVLLELEKSEQANAHFKEAAELYAKTLEVAPAELNAAGKVRILLSQAGCYFMLKEEAKAEEYYLKALELDSKDYSANISYVQFLVLNNKLEEAKQKLTVYKALLQADDPNMEAVNSLLDTIKGMIEAEENPTTTPEDGADTKPDEQNANQGEAK